MYDEWILVNVLKQKHIKSWSLWFYFHVRTLGRCSYNIKNTYRYVALLTFFIRFVITRIKHHRADVGGGRRDKIADKF